MDPLDPTTARLIDAALTISDAASTEARVEMSTLRRYLHPAANAYRAAHPTPPPVASPPLTEAQEARVREMIGDHYRAHHRGDFVVAVNDAPAVPDTVKELREACRLWRTTLGLVECEPVYERLLRAIDADQKAHGAK